MINESVLYFTFIVVSIAIIIYFYYKNQDLLIERETILTKRGIEHEEKNRSQIEINKQIWMTRNLNADKYQNGDSVILCQTESEWQQLNENKIPASCYYNFDETLADQYGRLYNWYAVNDPRGLAPKGWKIPNCEEIKDLYNISKDNPTDFKSRLGWKVRKGGRNSLGFSAFPSGVKCDNSDDIFLFKSMVESNDLKSILHSKFMGFGELTGFWSTTDVPKKNQALSFIISEDAFLLNINKSVGLNIRCIKDFRVTSHEKLEKINDNQENHQDDFKEKYI